MRWIALQACLIEGRESGQQPVMDAAALQQAVASIALGLTPRVALVDEAVLMDVTGSLRLFGGLTRMAQLLEERVAAFWQTHRLAGTILRAQGASSLIALARLRMVRIEHTAKTDAAHEPDLPINTCPRQRIAQLPMHTLTAAREHLDVLERIGCRTWDDLLRLPRDGMARRFGSGLLLALDRARGQTADSYDWLELPDFFEEKLELDALVIHAPALMAGVEQLLARLQAWLLGRQSGLSELRLTWHLDKRSDAPPTDEMDIRTAQPAQDLRHVTRLVAEHLAQQQLPAPVHSLTLRSLATEFLADSAAATASLLMQERRQGDSVVELVERLSARLGAGQVRVWQAAADHRPEQMQRWVEGEKLIHAMSRSSAVSPAKRSRKKAEPHQPIASRLGSEALYPGWLLRVPVRLATSGNSPVYQGRLKRLAGPQRFESTGWLGKGESHDDADNVRADPPVMRDYYIYRSEQAGLLWIYSQRLGGVATEKQSRHDWYLHGFFA